MSDNFYETKKAGRPPLSPDELEARELAKEAEPRNPVGRPKLTEEELEARELAKKPVGRPPLSPDELETRAKEKSAKAQKKIERLMKIARIMAGMGGGEFPPYDKTFGLLDESFAGQGGGVKRIIEISEDRTIRVVQEYFLRSCIAEYMQSYIGDDYPDFRFYGERDLKAVVDYFYANTPAIQSRDCKQIALKEEPGLAFSRLPFDFTSGLSLSDTPTFAMVLASCEYGVDSLLAFFGSLFDDTADKSQYLYLFGEGGSGKSTLTAFLRRILKGGAVVTEPPKFGDRFFMSIVLNKRLVIFSDVENYKVVSSPEVKALTGDSTVYVDIKGLPSFNAEVNAKLILCSNHEPGVSSKTSDTRRIIPVRMRAPEGGPKLSTSDMSDALDREAQGFLSICWDHYKKIKKGGLIHVDKEVVEMLAHDNEQTFNEAADNFLFFDPDIGLQSGEVSWLANQMRWDKGTRMAFTNWLKNAQQGVKYTRNWTKGTREKLPAAYYGVGIRAPYRKGSESKTPVWPSWSQRNVLEWKRFLEGLGHKYSQDGKNWLPDISIRVVAPSHTTEGGIDKMEF